MLPILEGGARVPLLAKILHGHAAGNGGYSQGLTYG